MINPLNKIISDESYFQTQKRFDAFLQGEVADRPPVSITFWKENKEKPPPNKVYPTEKARWMDVKHRAEQAAYNIGCHEYYADALPRYNPNLGPGLFGAMCGCPYHFAPETAWTEPCIFDWEKDAGKAVMNINSEYFIVLEEFVREVLKYAKDSFAVGLVSNYLPGADHLASLRGTEELCIDLIENPGHVKAKLKASYDEYFWLYDHIYSMINNNGTPVTYFLPFVTFNRYNVIQCDFSYLISPKMFEEFFLEGIIKESNRVDCSIYHLDGIGSLPHLDMILDIKKINAVQWEPGEGNYGFDRWIPIFQKIQKAKKGVFLEIDISELNSVISNLSPEGVWFASIYGINSKEDADKAIKKISDWR